MDYADDEASATAPAPLRAGLGHQLRGDQLLSRAVRHPARRAAARAGAAAGRAGGEATRRSRSRCSASAACASWSRAAARCPPTSPATRPTPSASARRARRCATNRRRRAWRRASTACSSTASPRARSTGYPTLCKGRFEVNDETYYAIEEPTSLNTLELLPQLMEHRRQGHQDRGPPAQPGLRRAGDEGVARGDRPLRCATARASPCARPGWPS